MLVLSVNMTIMHACVVCGKIFQSLDSVITHLGEHAEHELGNEHSGTSCLTGDAPIQQDNQHIVHLHNVDSCIVDTPKKIYNCKCVNRSMKISEN